LYYILLTPEEGISLTRNCRGFTLIELLVVVNIVAVLAGMAVVLYAELGYEARCTEFYGVFSRIIRSQNLYVMEHHRHYTALNQDQWEVHGVDLSDTQYFTYSTFPDESSSFSIRAEATDWAPGGWVLLRMRGDPQWNSDGEVIKRAWLPN
jgi:prepilin-type N-terminal cleavage/methylation domain-containing protein